MLVFTPAHRRRVRRIFFASVPLFLLTSSAPSERAALAETLRWKDPITGAWTAGENWCCKLSPPPDNQPLPPAASDDARINNGGVAQISSATAATFVYLGQFPGNSGTVEIYGGQLATQNVYLSDFDSDSTTGGSGTIRLFDSGKWINQGPMTIGYGGTGLVEIKGGEIAFAPGGLIFGPAYVMGLLPGSSGTVTVEDFNSHQGKWTANHTIEVGYRGTGNLHVKSGGEVQADYLYAGVQTESIANTITIEGANSILEVEQLLQIGVSGRGVMNVHSGASVSSAITTIGIGSSANIVSASWSANYLGLGGQLGLQGTFSANTVSVSPGRIDCGLCTPNVGILRARNDLALSNGGTLDTNLLKVVVSDDNSFIPPTAGDLYVGSPDGKGLLVMSTGAQVTLPVERTLYVNGADGTRATITGINTKISAGSFVVGDDELGQADVTNGAEVETLSAYIGNDGSLLSQGVGVVNVNNAKLSVLFNSPGLRVGKLGEGTLNVSNGGVVHTSGLYIGADTGFTVSGTGVVNVSGANSKIEAGDLKVGTAGTGTLNILNGAHVESSSAYIGSEDGSVGHVIVDNATWNTFGWAIYDSGHVELRNGGEAHGEENLRIERGGLLSGAGIARLPARAVINEGDVAPGNSPGTLTIDGNYEQGPTGRLLIELASPTSYDVLNVTGAATIGGKLEISLLGDYIPASTDTFNFLNAGSRSGAFNSVTVTSNTGGGEFSLTPTPTGFTLSNFQPGPITGGLVAHWNAENGAADVTGNGHDGVFLGDATTTTSGPFGKAFTFDGDGDFISIGDELDMGTSDFTLAAWIKGDPTMHQWARIFDKGYFTAYSLHRRAFDNQIGFEMLNSGNPFGTTTPLIDNTWHHVALVKSGTTVTIYADGEAEGSNTVSGAAQNNSLPLLIGFNPGEGIQGFWKGLLDELRIYDRALLPGEIAALAFLPEELDGDFNQDGRVDAADYVVWRKNPGGIYTQADYNVWRANFGAPGSGGGSQTDDSPAVPEPVSILLLGLAMPLFVAGLRLKLNRRTTFPPTPRE